MRYRVWLRSAPGLWERYAGKVDVYAEDDEQAVNRALAELRRTSFPDRPGRDSWIIEKIEKARSA